METKELHREETEKKAEALLRRLGLTGRYFGLPLLVAAIALVAEDPLLTSYQVTKALYPAIARRFQITSAAVERNIRTVVVILWERCDRDELRRLTGTPLPKRPTNSELIDILAHHIRAER